MVGSRAGMICEWPSILAFIAPLKSWQTTMANTGQKKKRGTLVKHSLVLPIVILISSLQWCLRASGFAYIGLIISQSWYLPYAVIVDTGLHRMSLGTGRPIVLRDENTIRHCRVLLSHPMASPTDVRLISLVELIAHKSMFPPPLTR